MHLSQQKYLADQIHPLPHGLRILSAIELDLNIEKIAKIQIINLYNPPKNFEGLDELRHG
jgi:hypothetical protein